MSHISKNIIDFIQLHYFTKRNDTEFWRWAKNNMQITDFNAEHLDYFKNNGVHPHSFTNPMQLFSHLNYMQVMHGLGMFNHEKINEKYKMHLTKYAQISKEILDENDVYEQRVVTYSHRESLNRLKERYLDVKYNL